MNPTTNCLDFRTPVPLCVVVSATFTAEPIGEYITSWGARFGEEIEVRFAPYHQVHQQLMDATSLLATNTGVNVLLVRFEDWLRFNNAPPAQQCRLLEELYTEFVTLFQHTPKRVPYCVGLFPVSPYLEPSVAECLELLNAHWRHDLAQMDHVFVVDGMALTQLYQIPAVFDRTADVAGHMPFTEMYYAALGTAITRIVRGIHRQHPFKVIVVDCDNTLWNGVCSEDGVNGVTIDTPYRYLQQFLLSQHDRGFLLALCSKNMEDDVWRVFNDHTDMVLSRKHLVGWRINWDAKSANLQALAEALQLGLASFVFLDDSPLECAEVMKHCPEVLTLQLPEDHAQIPLFLAHVWAFDALTVTEEDRQRTVMYTREQERQRLKATTGTLADFLANLNLQVYIQPIQEEQLRRIAQLTQRTNQFNLRPHKRTEEEIRHQLIAPGWVGWSISVIDRFGAYGLVGAIIAETRGRIMYLNTFLLSCRVLGRAIEDAMLTFLKSYCEDHGIAVITVEFQPTERNLPAADFLARTGWVCEGEASNKHAFTIAADTIEEIAEGVTIVNGEPSQPESPATPVGCPSAVQSPTDIRRSDEAPRWEVRITDDVQLTHRNEYLPLIYSTGCALLELPLRPMPSVVPPGKVPAGTI